MGVAVYRRMLVVGLLAGTVLTGCGSPAESGHLPATVAPSAPACAETGNVQLGRSGLGLPAAWFHTTGGRLQVTATAIVPDAQLNPKTAVTEVSIGTDGAGPQPGPQAGSVANARWQLPAQENLPAALELPAGKYWLTTSNGAEVRLALCQAGTIEAVSAPG